jgi:predicted transcriptional regulator
MCSLASNRFLSTTGIVAFGVSILALGELQAEILGVLQRRGKASVRDVMKEIGHERRLAYTTVSTVLDRLHKKGLVRRSSVPGQGGVRYIYSYATPPDMRANLVQRALSSLIDAFGPSVVPAIYDSLEEISKKETSELKRKVSKAQR